MAEQINLTIPKPDIPGLSSWRIVVIVLNIQRKLIQIDLLSNSGENKTVKIGGAKATTLIKQLNKANLSTKSLHKRILERLIADGEFNGTISGTPD